MCYDKEHNIRVNWLSITKWMPKRYPNTARRNSQQKNVEFPPKVLDAGETMVLFNLPRPWILLCGQNKRPTEIEIATYKVVDRKEFCECSLTAGSFQLDEALVKCTPEIQSEADGQFKSYFAINKIIFDYLQAERDVQLDSTVVQVLGRLLDVKPEYDWTPLNWYVNPDLPNNVINQKPSSVIADLMGVMEHIITEGKRKHIKAKYNTEMPKTSLENLSKMQKDGENLNLYPPFWA